MVRLSIEKRISLAFGGAILFVLLAGIYSLYKTSELVESTGWVDNTHQALDSLGDLVLIMDEAENAARGYVISGQESSLRFYREAAKEIDRDLEVLRTLDTEDPSRKLKVDTFARLVSSQLDSLGRVIDVRRTKGFGAAQTLLLARSSERPAKILGDVVRRMQAEQIALLIERTERSRRTAHRAVIAVLSSSLLGLVLLALAGMRVRRDVLARRKVEEDRSRLADIVESSEECIIGADLNGTIVSWNRGAETLYGWTALEALGRPLAMLAPDDKKPEVEGTLEEIRKGSRIQAIETTRVRKDGQRVDIAQTISPIRDADGAVVGVSAVVRDVSLRKKAEQETARARDAALELARLKAQFTANVSHEIRTPMNAIIGMTELLLIEAQVTPPQREYLETVRSSAESLLKLLNDVLDFSKAEAGKLELEMVDFNLRATLADSLQLLARGAMAKGLDLRLLVDFSLTGNFIGDPTRLRQVVINLVSNAIKFTEKGEIVLRAAKQGETDTDVKILFEIKDSGPGISPDGQARLFKPFSQVDSSTTRKHGGTGLGLTISKQIIELLGGELKLTSAIGKGSAFWFVIDLRKPEVSAAPAGETAPAAAPAAAAAPVALPVRTGRPAFKILVVDDNEVNQKVATLQLKKLGYETDTAPNGQAALEAIEKSNYDLVLMDCQMPVMDGFAATREIRSREGSRRHTPIIAMTANASAEDRQRCLDAGMDDHVSKPFKLQDLTKLLTHWDVAVDSFALQSLKSVAQDPEMFKEIVSTFLKDAEERLTALRRASADGRLSDVAKQAHALRGASGQVGAKGMASLSALIEKAAGAGTKEGIPNWIAQLSEEFARVGEALSKEEIGHG